MKLYIYNRLTTNATGWDSSYRERLSFREELDTKSYWNQKILIQSNTNWFMNWCVGGTDHGRQFWESMIIPIMEFELIKLRNRKKSQQTSGKFNVVRSFLFFIDVILFQIGSGWIFLWEFFSLWTSLDIFSKIYKWTTSSSTHCSRT